MNGRVVLPITKKSKLTKDHRYWSYIYAHNIKTIRDIFVYCAKCKVIDEKELYTDLANNKIAPPTKWWINPKRKREERLRLEYIHAARYLSFIKKKGDLIRPDFNSFKREKKIIIRENRARVFDYNVKSPPLTEKEKSALLKIVLNYERARDYLRWFLDFSKFLSSLSFDIKDFRKEAKPIFVLGETKKGFRGSRFIKRAIDGQMWEIPNTKSDNYIRLVSYVFPNWFIELGLIDRLVVFPKFSGDHKLWHMYYPIKMTEKEFLSKNIKTLLKKQYLKNRNSVTIWLPKLLYDFVKDFYCPVKAIKKAVEKLYKKDFNHFYLDRASLRASPFRHQTYKESYIKVDGAYRSVLKIFE